MHSSLYRAMADLADRTPRLLMAIAVVVFTLGYAAYEQMLEPYGLSTWIKFLAASVSLAVSIMYWLFFSYLLEVVALLPRADRARINPVILLMTVFILLSSSYPHVQKMGGGFASDIEDRNYVAQIMGIGERVKTGIRASSHVAGVIRNAHTAAVTAQEQEIRGTGSGYESAPGKPSPVADWKGGFATQFAAAIKIIAEAQEAATPIMRRMDEAAKAMESAAADKRLDTAARRAAMRAAASDFRAAFIDLGQTLPVASILALAKSLQGEIATPALSSLAHVRQGQRLAVDQFKADLARWGKAIEDAIAPLASVSAESIEPYNPPPIPLLVVKHAFSILNIIGVAVAVDLLGLGLYFFKARVHDALRRRPEEEIRSITVAELERAQEAEALLRAKRARREFGLIDRSDRFRLESNDGQGGSQ